MREAKKLKNAIAITILVVFCVAIFFVLVTGVFFGKLSPKTQTKDITIYASNGERIAEYKDATNITTDSRGGYIDFICDGKNYKYINCFIEVKESSQ